MGLMFHRTVAVPVLVSLFTSLLVVLSATQATASGAFERPLIFGISPVADFGMYEGDETYRDLVWRRLAEVGCRSVRLDASWRDIEEKRGERVWDEVDENVRRARAIGAEPVMLIVNTPGWASPTGKPVHDYPPREEMAGEFEDFCEELARRYLGSVRYYEFWNEQNGWGWHVDRGFQRADEYIPWLRRAYHGLKRGNPDCRVALGGMDDAAGHAWGFLEKFYRYRNEWFPGEDFLDAVADHPYSPDVETMKAKLFRLREIMAANGDGDKPMWITEYGWSLREVSEEEQARNLGLFLDAFASDELAFVEIANYLSIADFELSHLGFGVADSSLRPRPAFAVLRDHPRNSRPFHYDVRAQAAGPGAVTISWKTREPSAVAAEAWRDGERVTQSEGEAGAVHRLELRGLPAGETVEVVVATRGGAEEEVSLRYPVAVPGEGVVNGNFEAGFLGGTALNWTVLGKAFCYDSTQPFLKLSRSGRHAQVLHVRGGKGTPLDSVIRGEATVTPGRTYRLTGWSVTAADDGADPVARRVGVNPTGTADPEAAEVLWSEPVFEHLVWESAGLTFTPAAPVVPVFVKVEVAGRQAGGEYNVYVDDVTVALEDSPAP